jgi:hypothetical protein
VALNWKEGEGEVAAAKMLNVEGAGLAAAGAAAAGAKPPAPNPWLLPAAAAGAKGLLAALPKGAPAPNGPLAAAGKLPGRLKVTVGFLLLPPAPKPAPPKAGAGPLAPKGLPEAGAVP